MDLSQINRDISSAIDNTIPIINETIGRVINSNTSVGTWGFGGMLTTPIDSYCLVEMGDWQKMKHLYLSMAERNTTLGMIADSVSGISNKVSDETYKYEYSYTLGNNYLDDFQRRADKTTTRVENKHDNITHNSNYGSNTNLYPDDDNSGTDKFQSTSKWNSVFENRNRNSIIHKTKQLFNDRKINTIISRFHTDPSNKDLYDGTDAKTEYGLSHGRNLLTYNAEHNGTSYSTNGYDNPYCRVWTHHHQYSEYRSRLMRPFTFEGENGTTEMKNSDLHNWKAMGFKDMEYGVETHREIDFDNTSTKIDLQSKNLDLVKFKNVEETEKWSWKDSGKDGWDKSVLDKETGLVNIAPKFLGGAEKNIHTKDCMFSIENLAWQGYDPYSFERALSWEQRGPFGGRIMWFPPYGLTFNEESSVNWNEHSFIGRGENVYTYTNTSRSGTLSFMMVVDHPSILDYATWHEPSDLKDTDIMRFFAGCDAVSGESDKNGEHGTSFLASFARPTPLTDEYLKKDIDEAIPVEDAAKPKPEKPTEEPPATPDEEIKINFYAFFPNNYSGTYDDVSNNPDSKVDPIAYLLCGRGAQWKCDEADVTKSQDLPISFEDIKRGETDPEDAFLGKGYEMGYNTGITDDKDTNYIQGTYHWNTYKKGQTKYKVYKQNKWYHRIDGKYEIATGAEKDRNTFEQILVPVSRQIDDKGFYLNCDKGKVKEVFEDEKDNENLYTLAEIAYALLNNYDHSEEEQTPGQKLIGIKTHGRWDGTTYRCYKQEPSMKRLLEYFNPNGPYKVTGIEAVGYSSSHGYKKKNELLAEQRGTTVINWFKRNYSNGSSTINTGNITTMPSQQVNKEDATNESGLSAKKWRSAKVTLTIKKSKVSAPKDLKVDTYDTKYLSVEEFNKLTDEAKTKAKLINYKCKNEVKSDLCKIHGEVITVETYEKIKETPFVDLYEELYEIPTNEIKWQEEQSKEEQPKLQRFNGFLEVEKDEKTGTQLYINTNETDNAKKNRRWYYDENDKSMKVFDKELLGRWRDYENKWDNDNQTFGKIMNEHLDTEKSNINSLRYDQEYHFFKKLESSHPDVFRTLMDKLKYFDPAFHSMTPEGFMGRLNFLHQCTRQGNTLGNPNEDGHMANNLAFGRPPFCILRLGDFYYQKIVINNISINYDPLVLDLNNEGIGVVPLIANITISFRFIGGGDLTGPVRRLQSAMTQNFYANGRLYDNRADRIERKGTNNWDTMDMSEVDFKNSYFHNVKMKQ